MRIENDQIDLFLRIVINNRQIQSLAIRFQNTRPTNRTKPKQKKKFQKEFQNQNTFKQIRCDNLIGSQIFSIHQWFDESIDRFRTDFFATTFIGPTILAIFVVGGGDGRGGGRGGR